MREIVHQRGRTSVETILLGAIVILIAFVAAIVLLVTRQSTEPRERDPQVDAVSDIDVRDPPREPAGDEEVRTRTWQPTEPAARDEVTEIPPESERGGTRLRVYVTDPAGALVDGGHVACRSWERWRQPFDLDVTSGQRAPLQGEVVEFRLPWAVGGVWIDAFPEGYAPVRREILQLRHLEQPRRMLGEEIVLDVRIDASTTPPPGQLHGALLVDGVQRTPERVSIELLQRLNDRVRGDRVALVHPEDGTFVVDSLGEPWESLLIQSDESVPLAHPVDRDHDPARPIFVSLDTGATLHLTVIDGVGEPHVGLPVWCDRFIVVERGVHDESGPYRVSRSSRSESVTDASGAARLRGLTPGKDAVIYVEDAKGLQRRLLDLAADEVHGNVHRTVVLEDLVRTEIFGPTPQPGEFPGTAAGEPLAIRVQEFRGEKKLYEGDRELDRGNETWTVRTSVPNRNRLWLVQGEQVVSEVVEVAATGPEPIGPILFVPAAKTGRVVRWVNAPPDVALEVRAITESGRTTLVSHAVSPATGEVPFDFAADEVEIRVELTLPEGGSIGRRQMMGPGDFESTFDLAGDVSSRVEPRIEDESAEDGCRVILLALRAEPALSAMLTIHDGQTPFVSLPPGDYLAILERPALVCGIVRVPRGRDQRVKWNWQGKRVPWSRIFEGPPKNLALTSVDGVELVPLLPYNWRVINEEFWGVSAKDLESGEDPFVWYSESYRFEPYERKR